MGEFTTIKELETPVKVTRFLYFFDMVFIIVYAFVSYSLLSSVIHTKLDMLYRINCALWGIFLILPAVGNPRRKNWQSILNAVINVFAGKTYHVEKREVSEDDIK